MIRVVINRAAFFAVGLVFLFVSMGGQAGAQDDFFSRTLKTQLRKVMTCADESTLSMDINSISGGKGGGLFVPIIPPPPSMMLKNIREISPSANAPPATLDYEAISAASRFSAIAYDMYETELAGKAPDSAFDAPGLELAGVIYGRDGDSNAARTVFGFVAVSQTDPTQHYYVLRGTMRSAEWTRNAQAYQADFLTTSGEQPFKVHSGFYEIYKGLEIETSGETWDFADTVRMDAAGEDTLHLIGHSLGGALATLAGLDAADAHPEHAGQLNLVTFGAPRVGDVAATRLGATIGSAVRVCNVVDMVPTTPATSSGADYIHFGTLLALSSFDYPTRLNNHVEKYDVQTTCWHHIAAYEIMLRREPDNSPAECVLD